MSCCNRIIFGIKRMQVTGTLFENFPRICTAESMLSILVFEECRGDRRTCGRRGRSGEETLDDNSECDRGSTKDGLQ